MRTITPEYLAGFFDGEGCARLRRMSSKGHTVSMRAELSIGNTNLDILQRIQRDYGGNILTKKNGPRPIYILYWSSMDSIKPVLDAIAPHLVIKRAHAVLLQEYLGQRGSHMRVRYSERDREIFAEMASLQRTLRYRAEAA